MPRVLTARERAVLEHTVEDADAWWNHANSVRKIDAEAALAAKVARWESSYDGAVAAVGGSYQKRADRTENEPGDMYTNRVRV